MLISIQNSFITLSLYTIFKNLASFQQSSTSKNDKWSCACFKNKATVKVPLLCDSLKHSFKALKYDSTFEENINKLLHGMHVNSLSCLEHRKLYNW